MVGFGRIIIINMISYCAFEEIYSILESFILYGHETKRACRLENCYLLTNRIELLSGIIIVKNKWIEYL